MAGRYGPHVIGLVVGLPIASGELPDIAYSLAAQHIGFAAPATARLLRSSFAQPAHPPEQMAIAGLAANRLQNIPLRMVFPDHAPIIAAL